MQKKNVPAKAKFQAPRPVTQNKPSAQFATREKDKKVVQEKSAYKRQVEREERLVGMLKKEAVDYTVGRVNATTGMKKNETVASHYTPSIAAQKRKDFAYGFTHPNDFKHTWNFVKGAALDVLRLPPAALNIGGLLMTKHAPTQANALAAGRSDLIAKYTAPSGGPVPLQQGGLGSFSNCVGISSMKAINKGGLLYGQRCMGMDKLFDVPEVNPITGAAWAEGDLMATADLNPTGSDWSGTALIQQARIYNRYKVKKMCFLYATNVAATDEGSIILSVTPDPDSQYTGVGTTGTQLATAVTGAETCSIWAAGCTSWYGDKKQNFYSRPDGTDPRFTSPGILNVVCNAVLNVDGSGTTIGSVYVLYDIELTERSLEDSNQYLQFYAQAAAVSGQSGLLPFGTPQAFNGQSQGFLSTVTGALAAEIVATPELKTVMSAAYPGGSLATQIQYSLVGTKGVLSGFPVGDYLLTVSCTGTTLSAPVINVVNVGNPYYTMFHRGGITATGGGATIQVGLLRVLKQTTSAESYLDITQTATALATAVMWLSKFGDSAPYQVVPQSIMKMGQDIAVLRKQLEELDGRKRHDSLEPETSQSVVLPGSVPIYQDASIMRKLMPTEPPRYFALGEIVGFREVSDYHMKWINQQEERVRPSEKGFAFVIWSNNPGKLKVVSVSRILVNHGGDVQCDSQRTLLHNYEVAVRVFVEWQLKHASAATTASATSASTAGETDST